MQRCKGSALLALVLVLGGLLLAAVMYLSSVARQTTAWAARSRSQRQAWMAADLAACAVVRRWSSGAAPAQTDLAAPGRRIDGRLRPRTLAVIRELFGVVVTDVTVASAVVDGASSEGLVRIVVSTEPAAGAPGRPERVLMHWAWKAPAFLQAGALRFATAPITWNALD